MSAEMDALAAQAKANTDAEAAAVTLLNDLAGRVAATAGDRTASLKLASDLKASADALGAAIVTDTPADPNAPPPTP